MDFQDVEISVLAKFISEVTGRNFIVDDRVRGTVTIIAPEKISSDEAYAVFQSVLQVKGFTTVTAGRAIKIVPSKDAKETTLRTVTHPTHAAADDEFITRLARVRHADVSVVAEVLEPLVSRDGLVRAYAPANTLLIIDTASNVERLLTVVSHLDTDRGRETIEVVRLTHADAGELEATLNALIATSEAPVGKVATTETGSEPTVVADARTNSLLVRAGPTQLQQVRALIARIDVPPAGEHSRLHVYPLKHADAETMVEALGALLGVEPRPGSTRKSTVTVGARGGSVRYPAPPPGPSLALGARRAADAAATPPPRTVGGPDVVGNVRITAEPATNSLLISAAPQDFAALAAIVDRLDVPRPQVYVEAIILEISVDRAEAMGFQFRGATDLGGGTGLAALNLRDLGSAFTDPTSLSGLILAAASDETVTLPDGRKVPAQVALFNAIGQDTDVNILSAPNILTSDNEEAEIVVGQNVPFIASRATNETNLDNLFQTVERRDVGITLRITPQITKGQSVRLTIYEEVSALVDTRDPLVAELDVIEVGPTTNVRSASTSVLVHDAQTVVIGGLLADTTRRIESKVPYISSIPVLGHLFKNTEHVRMKTNLLIILTPHIIRTQRLLEANSRSQRQRMLAAVPPGRLSRLQGERLGEVGKTAHELPSGQRQPAPGSEWQVQAGSSQDAARAKAIVHQLTENGYRGFILPEHGTEGGWYRVRIGGLHSLMEAEVLASELRSKGFSGAFVPKQ
jgi:general secretion pathway protein D